MTDSSWMIAQVVDVPGVEHVVVLSADGLVVTRSQDTPREVAERLAAACSGLYALASSVAAAHGEEPAAVHQQMVEFGGGFLFIRSAGNSRLAVVTGPRINVSQVGQQMALQVRQIGERALSVAARGTAPE